MATEIKLPELGEGIDEAEVIESRVKPGDTVSRGQVLLVVQAGKTAVEVEAPQAGRVTKVLANGGDLLHVGQVYCEIEPSAAPAAAPAPKEAKRPAAPTPAPEAPRPQPAPAAGATRTRPEPEPDGGRKPAAPPAPLTGRIVLAGPATRRLARELGVNLERVRGSARGGRVTEEDVKAF